MTDRAPDLSVVIPCRNGAATLGKQLDALLQQEAIGSWEIVVADNGSIDATSDVIASFANATVPVRRADAGEMPGVNYARNCGVRAARGRVILLCDADDVVDPGWLRALGVELKGEADLVGGARLPAKGLNETGYVEKIPSRPVHGLLPRPGGGNAGFKREAYDTIGGFDESFRGGGDDTDFFWRAQLEGLRVHFVEDAVIRYSPRASLWGVYRQKYGFGRAQAQLYAKFRGNGMPRSSTLRAFWVWLKLPLYAVRIVARPARRRAAASILGFATGRLVGSWRFRVWYP